MNKVNKSDQIIRLAMLEVYKYKCFYTHEPLVYSDMEIDHIIPISLRDNKKKFNKIIEECGLQSNFELDSLYNLVPTNRHINREKSDEVSSENPPRYYLDKARKNVSTIEKKIEQLRKKRNFDMHLAMLKSGLNETKDENDRESLLETIYSIISDESEDFYKKDEMYSNNKEQIYKKYTVRMKLEAIMPRYDNPETQCIIYFREHKVSNCKVILDNKTILTQLFQGLFTEPKYGSRRFIEYKRLKKEHDVINLNEASIRLGNNKIKLSSEDIESLCEVVDNYASKYIKFIYKIEDVLKTHQYHLSKRKNNYKLISLSYDYWRKLLEFSSMYDADKGKSQWHMFDNRNNSTYLKIYTNKKHPKYNKGFHAFFYAEHSENIVRYPKLTSSEVFITWECLEDLENEGDSIINERNTWNAEIAYDWFVNKLIPKVLGREIWKNLFGVKRKSNIEVFGGNIDRVHYLDKRQVHTIKDLYDIVSRLQLHYLSHFTFKYPIDRDILKGLYNSILRCLSKVAKVNVNYIAYKLQLEECNSITDLIYSITQISNETEVTVITGKGLDAIFSIILESLESKKISLTTEDIHYLRENLDYFIKLHDRETLLEKYALDFE